MKRAIVMLLSACCLTSGLAFNQSQQLFLLCVRNAPPTPPLPYDAEVEYLESTGTQYINTGIYGRGGLRAKCSFAAGVYTSENPFPFCARRGPNQFGCGIRVVSSVPKFYAGMMRAIADIANADGGQHSIEIVTVSYEKYVVFDGVSVATSATANSYETQNNVVLFAHANATAGASPNCGSGRISSFSLYDETAQTLLLDYIAVRFTNEQGVSEGAMYDRVSGALFRNAGTGAFTIGPDK